MNGNLSTCVLSWLLMLISSFIVESFTLVEPNWELLVVEESQTAVQFIQLHIGPLTDLVYQQHTERKRLYQSQFCNTLACSLTHLFDWH